MVLKFRSKLLLSIFLIVFITAVGTSGYMIIEGWNFRDSLYMTVITLTTVGYGEVHELTPAGEIFTMIILILGVGIILYLLAVEAKIILSGELRDIIGRTRMEKRIKDLRSHYIICGYGRMGKTVAKELLSKDEKFIIVEKSSSKIPDDEEHIFLEGDATIDEVLKKAGIERAKGLVSVLPTDAENLFVVLSARELNPKLLIVTRASEETSEIKILRAGADRVVSPYYTGGLKIAHMILKPAVVDFIEFATKNGNLEIQMEEVAVRPGSSLAGAELEETGIVKDLGIIIIAVKKSDGTMQFNPASRAVIEQGDTLIALGEITKLNELERLSGKVAV
ncbi:MAG: potassium channel protein [Deltaproteobacteria bacterium]